MNPRRLFRLAACCAAVSLHATAQTPAPAVTDADIAGFQRSMETGCVARGLARKAPEDEVRHFCGCMSATLKRTLSHAEWLRAMEVAASHDEDGLQALIQPHFGELQACKGNDA